MQYCESIFKTQRWKTREVKVGKVGVGGDNPIRIQSMTTSNTRDAVATAEQIIRLADAGCEIARVTVQGMKEAESCEEIKNILVQKGYEIPLVADIHFYPPAAMRVADSVDKVRINPGNFVDKRASFKIIEYDDATYQAEIDRIEEGFTPLVEKCKRLKRAMRIGTNHGSLSDRIMNRYGDTAFGMVESALEFARVCRKLDYHDFIFSMKASNPIVMIQAYRLLVAEMMRLGWDYPLHLGVTEAGAGEDGRVKSAVGIGSLLLDGIRDTIRVSLTEDPWEEIDPCKRLVDFASRHLGRGIAPFEERHRDVRTISRRQVHLSKEISLHRDGSVVLSLKNLEGPLDSFYEAMGYKIQFSRPIRTLQSADLLLIENLSSFSEYPLLIRQLNLAGIQIITPEKNIEGTIPLLSLEEVSSSLSNPFAVTITDEDIAQWEILKTSQPLVIFLSPKNSRLHFSRLFFDWMKENALQLPVILCFDYVSEWENLVIEASSEIGSLLSDGIGDGICIQACAPIDALRTLSFNLLQAARMRSSKTEYISCPGCGRTLFDLQSVAKRIRERTGHLAGVKIAIMGCIVNGPGEMADADFGYVGSRPGEVDLYVGKTCVEKGIKFSDADDRLIELIKLHDRWKEPENELVTV